jgi:hypothetical protein
VNVYDVAQICLNGHVMNPKADTNTEHSKEYCNKCGKKCIIDCPACFRHIRGAQQSEDGSDYEAPKYCIYCGEPFPWMMMALDTAKELIEIECELTKGEKDALMDTLPDLVSDTPRGLLAVRRIVMLGKKISAPLYKVFIDLSAETCRRMLKDSM